MRQRMVHTVFILALFAVCVLGWLEFFKGIYE